MVLSLVGPFAISFIAESLEQPGCVSMHLCHTYQFVGGLEPIVSSKYYSVKNAGVWLESEDSEFKFKNPFVTNDVLQIPLFMEEALKWANRKLSK